MIETREFDLQWEGRRCTVNQLPAKAARQVAVRLANLIGTALRGVGESGSIGSDCKDLTLELVGAGSVLERLGEADVDWLTQTFMKVTEVENEAGSEVWVNPKEVEDLVFGGGAGLERWRRWLMFCIEMSCGDFFAGASAQAGALQKGAAKRTSPSQHTSPSRTSSIGSQPQRSTPIV